MTVRSPGSPESGSDTSTSGSTSAESDRTRTRVLSRVADVLAVVVLWLILVAPSDLAGLTGASLLRLPGEALVIVAVVLLIPARGRTPVAISLGLILGIAVIVKIADIGFLRAFDRISNPLFDWVYLGSGIDLLNVSVGRSSAIAILILAALVVVVLVVASPWALLRVLRLVGRHRSAAGGVLIGGTTIWIALALLGTSIGTAGPLASWVTGRTVVQHAVQAARGLSDQQTLAEAAAVDPLRQIPDDQLLGALRGKDVIVAFVESYGRIAVEGSAEAVGVGKVLDEGTKRLADAGFASRSAFLTSPTFGGISWLAHSTLQSGLWIDSQQRYDQLLETDRATLSDTFHRSGWRTVSDVPSNKKRWAEGQKFYKYDAMYDANNVGYQGPRFSYATMPDQYVLAAFRRLELASPDRPNVMAEIDLVSSHTPWTPLPKMVPWSDVGNGSVFDPMPSQGPTPDELWRDAAAVQAAYGRSIEYTLSALISFVETYRDPNLVLVILGDHQPATIVSGSGASHDVPVTIVAHDPAVMARIDNWGWQDGMRPSPTAPVTLMDTFRDRFVTAFSDAAPQVRTP